jgi:hypothetical protein
MTQQSKSNRRKKWKLNTIHAKAAPENEFAPVFAIVVVKRVTPSTLVGMRRTEFFITCMKKGTFSKEERITRVKEIFTAKHVAQQIGRGRLSDDHHQRQDRCT